MFCTEAETTDKAVEKKSCGIPLTEKEKKEMEAQWKAFENLEIITEKSKTCKKK